ncbi:MAG: 50S ribosomal protein L3 N(5)-glutamine methyltransferase [Burkholderiales bacterium]|nr:50S ribosomal protein L3 N(5)-glutamine methyltransferase [Burkholderiales bacterium]
MDSGAATRFDTLRDLLRYAVTCFERAQLAYGHGSQNAYDEAAYLLLRTLHLPLDRLEPFLDARLLPDEVAAVLQVIERRVTQRLPAAYITREAWLGDYRFYIDERAIVPRSHIAELILQGVASSHQDPEFVSSCLDLCTGSGCLAVLLALAYPDAVIDAVDVSHDALEVAQRNVADYALQARVRLIQSDLFAALSGRQYQVIVSNPPYVSAEDMAALPQEYRHEPAMALAGGTDGLDLVRRILAQARAHLAPEGILLVEIGSGRERLEAAFPELDFTWLETSAGGDPVFLLERDQLPD